MTTGVGTRNGWIRVWISMWLVFGVGSIFGEVTVSDTDMDADGQPERILENECVRIEIMTGIPPAPPPGPSFMDKLLKRGIPPYIPKYDKRFSWGGWIYNVTSKSTGQRWFANVPQRGGSRHGIPEEFEVAIKTKEIGPNQYEVFKVGVGMAEGPGHCLRHQLKNVRPLPWTETQTTTASGGMALTFEQKGETDNGYGFTYTKTITLEPGCSQFEVRRVLRNTGTEPFRTIWYSHAFWEPAAEGEGFDDDCWCTIPLKAPADVRAYPAIDTKTCFVGRPQASTSYWGPIDARTIGGNWYASGNAATGDVFTTQIDTDLAWFRIWTYSSTYSCEPFVDLALDPGETKEWTILRGTAAGLTGADAPCRNGIVDWEQVVGAKGDRALQIRFAPFRVYSDVSIKATFAAEDSTFSPVQVERPGGGCSPIEPAVVTVPLPAGNLPILSVEITAGKKVVAEITQRMASLTEGEARNCSGVAGGAGAIVIAELGKKSDGTFKGTTSTSYLTSYLSDAGFDVVLALPKALATADIPSGVKLIVLDSRPRLAEQAIGRLEKFVEAGGGLLLTGGVRPRQFEFSDLVPITETHSEVTVLSGNPRDGTDEFLNVNERRYHLSAVSGHPALQGIPFFPAIYQGLAALQIVEPAVGAQVVLHYVPGSDVQPQTTTPALVTKPYGNGRVAVFLSPVAWGSPPLWTIWGRVGEYHRQFFSQLGLWTAGLLNRAE